MKKVVNTPLPADEHFPYGGYYLQRTLNNGRVLTRTIKRSYGTSDWMWAQDIKRARQNLLDARESK